MHIHGSKFTTEKTSIYIKELGTSWKLESVTFDNKSTNVSCTQYYKAHRKEFLVHYKLCIKYKSEVIIPVIQKSHIELEIQLSK